MNGVDKEVFNPDGALTRGMLVTILYRQAGNPDISGADNIFNDLAEGEWYSDAVKWASSNGIVTGYGDSLFGPNDNITRPDLVVVLSRYTDFMEKELSVSREYTGFSDDNDIADYAKAAVLKFYCAEVVNGKPDNIFDPNGQATRAEAAAMLRRFLEKIIESL